MSFCIASRIIRASSARCGDDLTVDLNIHPPAATKRGRVRRGRALNEALKISVVLSHICIFNEAPEIRLGSLLARQLRADYADHLVYSCLSMFSLVFVSYFVFICLTDYADNAPKKAASLPALFGQRGLEERSLAS